MFAKMKRCKNKIFKQITVGLLVLITLFSLAACKKDKQIADDPTKGNPVEGEVIGSVTNIAGVAVKLVLPKTEPFELRGSELLDISGRRDLNNFSSKELDDTLAGTELGAALKSKIERAVSVYNNEQIIDFNSHKSNETWYEEENTVVIVKGAVIGTLQLASSETVYQDAIDALREGLNESLITGTAVERGISIEGTAAEATEDDDSALGRIYNSINAEPVSSKYDPETFGATESVLGKTFDMAEAGAMLKQAATGAQVRIPLIISEPEITKEQLESMLFRDVLIEKTTYVSGTSNRLNNITLAQAACNGKIVNPGDTFSYNETLGERTTEKGYKTAGAYSGGTTVQEVGGGICQVSSMIYYCLLHTDLEVVERRPHMFVVTYLPYGHDATVNWGTIDLKFKNNTEFPLKISFSLSGRDLTIKLIGTQTSARTIKTEQKTVSVTDYNTEYKVDASVPMGSKVVDTEGHGGYVVEVYKHYYENGVLVDTVYVGKSSYRSQARVILVPAGTLDENGDYVEALNVVSTPEPSPDPGITDPDPNTTEPGDDTGTEPSEPSEPADNPNPPEDDVTAPSDDGDEIPASAVEPIPTPEESDPGI